MTNAQVEAVKQLKHAFSMCLKRNVAIMFLDEDFHAFDRKSIDRLMADGLDPGDAAQRLAHTDKCVPLGRVRAFVESGMWGTP